MPPTPGENQTALDVRLAAEVLRIAASLGFKIAVPRGPGRPSQDVDPKVLAARAALGRGIRVAVEDYATNLKTSGD